MRKTTILIILSALIIGSIVATGKETVVEPSFAWRATPPLGLHEEATIDTSLIDYSRQAVPSEVVSPAYATTGNFGTEGINMLFFERAPISDFFFRDAMEAWLSSQRNMKFYNTRIPMTLLSYNTGGGREAAQDRLKAVFSGNINARAQIGANIDYIYSKGSYNNQAAKGLIWGFSGSYIGERYELQAYFNHWNFLNKENGGITDDLYITDPAELQGGSTSVDTKSIPTRLTNAHSRLKGTQLYINNRYKIGYWQEESSEEDEDSIVRRTYIPVSSFIWTLKFDNGEHNFRNDNRSEAEEFWQNTYLRPTTLDVTSYWSLTNTFGISLLEGFHKYAKAGLGAFVTHQIRRYTQTPDTLDHSDPEIFTPFPDGTYPENGTENLLWVGAQLTKRQGSLLRYNVTGQFGLIGSAAADLKVEGDVSTRFRLFGDTVSITGYGAFRNEAAPYLMKHYISNHFMWDNDFGKTRSLRIGGILNIPHTKTRIDVGVENIQNHLYFNDRSMPTQHGGSVQVFSASLNQDFRFKALNWNNRVTYQTSSNQDVIPLPQLTVYSNLYLLFKVAKVLNVQFGIDCDYYTSYNALGYQPALMSFYNQREVKVGNYPFMNAYINMKLSRARFYVLFSHFNQGMFGGSNYFSAAHYPLNPRRFQMGISVDFAN